ncbi:NUDIX hydrolase [Bacillus sp. T33-2]|uniref:NUDIX hydrolase n=1 Tax=Bacillus sp. T33-2 TaxID=2054168 RepID=UPI000C77F606|nr:NUDIX hydrolase [Bacillus sp. T33-2]PLR95062.1 ADP-ribose pyrophosphatase [Bacillus sp. T33-2]
MREQGNGQVKWLEWAKQIQAISQAGLTYSKDIYDIERFQQLRELSVEILAEYTDLKVETITKLFANETGYQTPKVDVRAVVFNQDRILLVQEQLDGKWSLPGGWADIGLTPSEVAVKEVKEEAGFEVVPLRLLAVLDKKCHPHPPSPYHVYKMFIQCGIVGGKAETGIETKQVNFFPQNNLPVLSVERNTESQIHMAFEFLENPQKNVIVD